MRRTRAGAWLAYTLAGLVATAAVALLIALLAPGVKLSAVLAGAGAACVVQLAAFAALLALRGQTQLFMLAWLGGMVLRFAVLGAGAYLLSRSEALPRGATLISYVGFVFLLLMLEPLFLRWDTRGS